MTQRFDVILKGGTVVNQDGEAFAISASQAVASPRSARCRQAPPAEVIDCKGLHILPGVIDTQVHFREPGLEHKEDLETGSRSAVMGGVTAVFEMPNTNAADGHGGDVRRQGRARHHRMHCDFAFFIGGTRENVAGSARCWSALPGCAGVKVFMGSSTGALLVEDDEGLRRIIQVIRRRAAFHAEDE